MNKLFDIIADHAGGSSSIRVLMLFWGLVILGAWAYVSFQQKALAVIPESVIITLGSMVSAKVVQRFSEKETPQEVDKDKKE